MSGHVTAHHTAKSILNSSLIPADDILQPLSDTQVTVGSKAVLNFFKLRQPEKNITSSKVKSRKPTIHPPFKWIRMGDLHIKQRNEIEQSDKSSKLTLKEKIEALTDPSEETFVTSLYECASNVLFQKDEYCLVKNANLRNKQAEGVLLAFTVSERPSSPFTLGKDNHFGVANMYEWLETMATKLQTINDQFFEIKNERLREQTEQHTKLIKANNTLVEQNKKLDEEKNNLVEEKNNLVKEKQTLKETTESQERLLSTLRGQLDTSHQSCSAYEREKLNLEKRVHQLNDQLKTLQNNEDTTSTLQQELKNMRVQWDKEIHQTRKLQQDLKHAALECLSTREFLKTSQTTCNEQATQISELQQEIAETQEKHDQMSAAAELQLQSKDKEIQNLREQMSKLQQSRQRETQTAQQENAQKESTFQQSLREKEHENNVLREKLEKCENNLSLVHDWNLLPSCTFKTTPNQSVNAKYADTITDLQTILMRLDKKNNLWKFDNSNQYGAGKRSFQTPLIESLLFFPVYSQHLEQFVEALLLLMVLRNTTICFASCLRLSSFLVCDFDIKNENTTFSMFTEPYCLWIHIFESVLHKTIDSQSSLTNLLGISDLMVRTRVCDVTAFKSDANQPWKKKQISLRMQNMRKIELQSWYLSNVDLFNNIFGSSEWPRVGGLSQLGAYIEQRQLETYEKFQSFVPVVESSVCKQNEATTASLQRVNTLARRLSALMYNINPVLSEEIVKRMHTSSRLFTDVHLSGCYRELIMKLLRYDNCIEYVLTPLAKLFYFIALQIVTYDACDFPAALRLRDILMKPAFCAKILHPCLWKRSTDLTLTQDDVEEGRSAITTYLNIHHGKRHNIMNRAAISAFTAIVMLMQENKLTTE